MQDGVLRQSIRFRRKRDADFHLRFDGGKSSCLLAHSRGAERRRRHTASGISEGSALLRQNWTHGCLRDRESKGPAGLLGASRAGEFRFAVSLVHDRRGSKRFVLQTFTGTRDRPRRSRDPEDKNIRRFFRVQRFYFFGKLASGTLFVYLATDGYLRCGVRKQNSIHFVPKSSFRDFLDHKMAERFLLDCCE